MWLTGEILKELGWTALFLIPKGNTYTRGIGLLETLLKVIEALKRDWQNKIGMVKRFEKNY